MAELVKDSATTEEEIDKHVLLSLRNLINEEKKQDQLNFERCGDRKGRPEDEIVIDGGIWIEEGEAGNLPNQIAAIVKRKRQLDKERDWEVAKKARNKRKRRISNQDEGGMRNRQMKIMFQELIMLTDSEEALNKQVEKDMSQNEKKQGEVQIVQDFGPGMDSFEHRKEVEKANKKRQKIHNRSPESRYLFRTRKRDKNKLRSIMKQRKRSSEKKQALRIHWKETLEEVKIFAAMRVVENDQIETQEIINEINEATEYEAPAIDILGGMKANRDIEAALGLYSKRHSNVVKSNLHKDRVWICGKSATIPQAIMTVRIYGCMQVGDSEMQKAQLKKAMEMAQKLENLEEQSLEQECIVPIDVEHEKIYGKTDHQERMKDFKKCMTKYHVDKGELKEGDWPMAEVTDNSPFFDKLRRSREAHDNKKVHSALLRAGELRKYRQTVTVLGLTNEKLTAWLDSGAEITVLGKKFKGEIKNLRSTSARIVTAGGKTIQVDGRGLWKGFDVYFMDKEMDSLMSVHQVLERYAKHGWEVNFNDKTASLMRFDKQRRKVLDEVIIGTKLQHHGMWMVNCRSLEQIIDQIDEINQRHVYKVMYDIPIKNEDKPEYWHRVFGHTDGLYQQVKRGHMTGMDEILRNDQKLKEFCNGCIRGKMDQSRPDKAWLDKIIKRTNNIHEARKTRRNKIKPKEMETKNSDSSTKDKELLRLGEVVHLDISGPWKRSIDGYRWGVTAICEGTNHQWRRTLKKKDHIVSMIENVRRDLETLDKDTKDELKAFRKEGKVVIKKLIVDGDGIFRKQTKEQYNSLSIEDKEKLDRKTSKEIMSFKQLCERAAGVDTVLVTGPYSHQMNGKAEAAIRRAQEQTRCMVFDAPIRGEFWSYAWRQTEQFVNLLGHGALPKRMSSYQYRTGKVPNWLEHSKYLYPFGSTMAVHLAVEKRSTGKIREQGRIGFYLGKAPDTKGSLLAVVGKRVYKVPVNMLAVDGTKGGSIHAAVREKCIKSEMLKAELGTDTEADEILITEKEKEADSKLKFQEAARAALEISQVLYDQILTTRTIQANKKKKEAEIRRKEKVENNNRVTESSLDEMIRKEKLISGFLNHSDEDETKNESELLISGDTSSRRTSNRKRRRIQSNKEKSEERHWKESLKLIGKIGVVNFGPEEHIFTVVKANRKAFNQVSNSSRKPHLLCIFPPQHDVLMHDKEWNTAEEVRRCLAQFKKSFTREKIKEGSETLIAALKIQQQVIRGTFKEEECGPFYNRKVENNLAVMKAKVLTHSDISSRMDRLTVSINGDDIEEAVRQVDESRRTHNDSYEMVFAEHEKLEQQFKVYYAEDKWTTLGDGVKNDGLEFDSANDKVFFYGKEVDYTTVEPLAVEEGSWRKVSTQKDAPITQLRWHVGARKEDRAFNRKSIYDIVDRSEVPAGEKILHFFRLVKKKRHETGHKCYKIRNCINGKGMEGDYASTWSPTVRNTSIRAAFKLCAYYGGVFASTDQSSAFLANDNPKRPDGSEQIYHVSFPENFFAKDGKTYTKNSNKVMRLRSSCYGLRSAARQLFELMRQKLTEQGYIQCEEDKAMFFKVDATTGRWAIAGLWVDDIGMWASDVDMVTELKDCMISGEGSIEMTVEHEPKRYCGFNIGRIKDADGNITAYTLDTNDYVEKIVAKWGKRNGKEVPDRDLPGNFNVTSRALEIEMDRIKDEGLVDEDEKELARTMVGAVMYQCGKADPMIAPQVNRLATTMIAPSKVWFNEFYHLIGFLKRRMRKKPKLIFRKRESGGPMIPELAGLSDASFNSTKIGKSLGGYLIFLAGDVIAYKTGLSSVVTLSTTEAEASICSLMVREMLWAQKLLTEIGLAMGPGRIGIDNIGALKNFVGQGGPASRHTQYKINHVRKTIADGLMCAEHVGTKVNVSDCLSKPIRNVGDFRWFEAQIYDMENPDNE